MRCIENPMGYGGGGRETDAYTALHRDTLDAKQDGMWS
jgi:hypothetical protein